MSEYIIAVDQGTTSTRATIFDHDGRVVSSAQREQVQIMLNPGHVEHDPLLVWRDVQEVMNEACTCAGLGRDNLVALGITNQRETTVVWDRHTGIPVFNAIVWQDTRTKSIIDRVAAARGSETYRQTTGLPLATYFSAGKVAWILENVPKAYERACRGDLLFGTMDSWLVWNFTRGAEGGIHITDVSNASRTLLMDLSTLRWSQEFLNDFGIPEEMLPRIVSSSEEYGKVVEPATLSGLPITSILGDQQAAAFGQSAFSSGEGKNTYGTGCFVLFQTGTDLIHSTNGLLTTVGYKLGDEPVTYALEGSIAAAGSVVQWLRDELGLIESFSEVEKLANSVDNNGGVYIVPAFAGLFAPYWDPDARGTVVGLTRYSNRSHIARAVLESVAFQTREVLDAVCLDSGVPLQELRVDGGMTVNEHLMQFQADILGVPVVRPEVIETTALGAAYAAGLAAGFWSDLNELRSRNGEHCRWLPTTTPADRDRKLRIWRKAIKNSMNWVDEDLEEDLLASRDS